MPTDLPTFQFREQTTGRVTALLVGGDGVTPLPASSLISLQLTLYVIKQNGTDEVINGRNQQDVLNANNVQVLETPVLLSNGRFYNFAWVVQPADTTIIETFLSYERHIALLEWGWPIGNRGKEEFVINVKNLRRVM